MKGFQKSRIKEENVEGRDVLVQIEEETDDEEDELNELSFAEVGQDIALKDLNLIKLVLSIDDATEQRVVGQKSPSQVNHQKIAWRSQRRALPRK